MGGMSWPARGAALVVACLAAGAAAAQQPLAERLIALRGEVEQLNSELELLREEQRTTLAGLNAQQAELRASVDRQQLAAAEARRKLDEASAAAEAAGVSSDTLKPRLLEAIDALQRQIASGLPFKTEERLGALAQLRGEIDNGSLPAPRAVNRLWAFYEDEFRLTRDNSLHAQTIEVGGERLLADVAKVGSMALYFRSNDGRVGRAVVQGGRWSFVAEPDPAAQQQIRTLFDALGKQIRQGYFELPMAVAGGAR
jgi:hypothetical protein